MSNGKEKSLNTEEQEKVIIINDNEHLDILANNASTISYEILTNLHARLPRIIIRK